MNQEDLEFVLGVEPDTTKLSEALEEQGEKLDDIANSGMAAIEKSLERQRAALAQINKMLDPATLKERVRLEREIAEAHERVKKAEAKESREQTRPGFFQKLFQDPEKAFGDIGKSMKGFGNEVKEEFSKGGAGGLMDSVMSALKGGGGGGGGGISELLGGLIGGAEGGAGGALAGAAEGALGGPIGIAIAAAMEAVKVVGKGFGAAAKAAVAPLKGLDSALRSLQGPLGPIGLGLETVSAGMNTFADAISGIPVIGDLLGPMAKELAALPGVIQSVLTTLTHFASLASPGRFELFSRALLDVQAVIGHSFMPVLDMMTQAVRLFGDVLATVLPDMNQVNGALSEVRAAFNDLNAQVRNALGQAGPMLRGMLIDGLQALATALSRVVSYVGGVIDFWSAVGELYEVFRELMSPIMELVRELNPLGIGFSILGGIFRTLASIIRGAAAIIRSVLSYFGLVSPTAPTAAPSTSVGASAGPAQMQDISSYLQQLQTSAYSEGVPTMADVPVQVGNISTTLNNILEAITVLTDPSRLATVIAEGVSAGMGRIRDTARDAVNKVIPNVIQGIRHSLGARS